MTIEQLEKKLDNLEQAVLQIARNNVPVVSKVDDTTNKVDAITPYTDTRRAYYGEREKTFYEVPSGNVSVFFSNYNGDYAISRIADRLTVSFDTLEYETDVTISIQ